MPQGMQWLTVISWLIASFLSYLWGWRMTVG